MISNRHEALERLSPIMKIKHWAKHDPWAGIRISQKTVVTSRDVLLDAHGNIVRMPLLIGKPCFGQPTAFARHGGVQPILQPVRGYVPSRCMRCSAREACERVAKLRLRVTPEIQDAHQRFEKAGGAYGLKHPTDCPAAARQFSALVDVLVRHGGFRSENDGVVLAHFAKARKEARLVDAKKRRSAQIAAAREGELDADVVALLDDHRRWREALLRVAIRTPNTIRRISSLPPASATVTADAWLARLRIQLRRKSVNNSSVAREMMALRPEQYKNHNSLRQRVEADLLRVDTLERVGLPGQDLPVWPRFNLRTALTERDQLTHYTAELR